MEERQYCLKWNNFQSTIATALEGCYIKEEFVDVTICAEGRTVKAHRVLLSACSPYFKSIFVELDSREHPVIFLRDTPFADLQALINFIYHGEVCVIHERLSALFKLAQMLEIKGLATDKKEEINGSDNRSPDGNVIDCMDILDRLTAVNASQMPLPEENPVFTAPINSIPHLDLPSQMRHLSPRNHNRHPSPLSHRGRLSPLSHHRTHVSPIINKKRFSPPSKKRKILSSLQVQQMLAGRLSPGGPMNHAPVIAPAHTPPDRTPPRASSVPNTSRETLRLLQRTPPPHPLHHQVTPSSCSSHSEEDSRVVNLSINNGGSSSPDRIYPKLEYPKLEYDDVPGHEPARDAETELGQRHPSELTADDCHVNSTCPDLPLFSRLSLQRYEPYATHLDLAGPSRMLSTVNPTSWKSSVSLTDPSEQQGSHPVFNELFGEGASSGGKKAVPTPCPICRKVLSNAYNMRVHLETHQDTTYKCIVCGIVTRTKDTMRKHCSNVHQLRNVEFKKSFKIISGKTGSPPCVVAKSPGDKSTPKKRFNPLANLSGLLKPKKEPILTSPTMEVSDATNLAKGSSLASIVSKLSQKQ